MPTMSGGTFLTCIVASHDDDRGGLPQSALKNASLIFEVQGSCSVTLYLCCREDEVATDLQQRMQQIPCM